jgi:SAM-dependent methyltransferase
VKEKNHWYDGWIYDKFIAPNQDKMFSKILNLIEEGTNVVDVGCGTGRFSFLAVNKVDRIIGVDLSLKNIEIARKTLESKWNNKISFSHSGIEDIDTGENKLFDYAVMTYVIHEIQPEDGIELLKTISRKAKKIIIGDYLVPQPDGLVKVINELVEFFAGSEHYENYKKYTNNGGIEYLAEVAGLKIDYDEKNLKQGSRIIILKGDK